MCICRKLVIDLLDGADCSSQRASVVAAVEGIQKEPSSPTRAIFVVVEPASIPRIAVSFVSRKVCCLYICCHDVL